MIRQKILIPRYDWNLTILYDTYPHDASYIVDMLADMGCAMRHLERAEDMLLSGIPNQGLTYSDKKNRETLIVVGHANSVGEFINTVTHELNHTVDHISQYYGIPYASEENAYLTGDLTEMVWDDAWKAAKDIFIKSKIMRKMLLVLD